MIVEIIQPDLAPGNDLWPLCQFPHLLEIGIACKLGLVRMNSNGRVNEVVLFGELDPAVERPGAGSAADRDNRFDSGFAGASEHLLTVGIKLLHLEMCMGIDEHRSLVVGHWLCSAGGSPVRLVVEVKKLAYFSLVPTGTSSRKPASTAFPPSGDAATIIPFDSSPRSFLGARFATITTFLPINNSGAYDSAIPATTWRTSVPRSTSRRSNLSAPFTFSAALTCPTRSSIFAKSSMLIFPSGTGAAGFAAGAGAAGVAAGGFVIACGAASGCASVVGPLRCCSSIFCILSIALLSARGNTGSTLPSFVPS